ncbi:MAG TPA: glycosyltransferase, partial [Bacteroidales bacterium]|nr:glycosyltransferase [Bacteroidales bacterium]
LEAMAAGCRPIVSDLPSNREWIQHGHNGIVATDLDANMIQQALDLDYTQLMETNLDLIRKKAMRDTNRQRFLDIYQRLLVP